MRCFYCGRDNLEWSDSGYKGFLFDKSSGMPHKCNYNERKNWKATHKPQLGESPIKAVGSMLYGVGLNTYQRQQRALYMRMDRENRESARTFNPRTQMYPADLFILTELRVGDRGEIIPKWTRNPVYRHIKDYMIK